MKPESRRFQGKIGGVAVDAINVAGVETCIELPEFRLAFDIGRAPASVIPRPLVFLSHAHLDHFSGLAYHAGMRSMRGMEPPTYVVPAEILDDLHAYFAVLRRLDGGEFPYQAVPFTPGERFVLRPDAFITAFRTDHRIPSLGYCLWERRKKLRPEHVGRDGEELARLHRSGEEIHEVLETPALAFTGDTTIEVVEEEEVVRTARVLIIEATFVGDHPTVDDARSRGHIHLDEIAARAELFENQHLVLGHFSTRYPEDKIREEVRKALPESLWQRTTLLL